MKQQNTQLNARAFYGNPTDLIEPFRVSAKPQGIAYTVNVDDNFEHPRQFENIVHVLDNADEGDVVTINLSTDGGALHSILPLLGAMENSMAHVHVHCASDVASAGTFLLMRAQSVSMNDYVTVMFHNASFGVADDGWSVEKHVEHSLKSNKRILRDMYKHMFTDAEIGQMLTGTPFYMDKEEFIQRYTRRSELFQKEMEGALKPKRPRKPKKPVDTTQ